MQQLARIKRPSIFYGYIVVIAAFIMRFAWGGAFQSYGVFFKPLSTEFGWTRATTSGALSLFMLLAGAFTILAGRLIDRFGPRLLMTICGLFLGLGFLLMSQISAVWQLYLFYAMPIAIGFGGTGDAPTVSLVMRWFVKRRALMSGIVAAGVGIGTTILVPLISRFISAYGWRTSYVILATVALVLIMFPAQFLKRDPSQVGQLPYGAGEVKAGGLPPEVRGFTLREAARTGQFWMLCGLQFCTFFGMVVVGIHIIPHATDLGISLASAANILAIRGGLAIPGNIIIGGVADRFGRKPILISCYVLTTATLFWLVVAQELWMFYLIAGVLGFFTAGARILVYPITAEVFGLSSIGVILGSTLYAGIVGGSIGPTLAGKIFDETNSYQLGFLISAALTAIGLILALFLRTSSREGKINTIRRGT